MMKFDMMNRRFVDEFFTQEELEYLKANQKLCETLIAQQDLVFWTRQLIAFRQEVKGILGHLYLSNCTDFVFIHALRNLASGKNSGKFFSLICSSFSLKPLRNHAHRIEEFLEANKFSERAALKKAINEMLPPHLLKACNEIVVDGLDSSSAVVNIKQEMGQVICGYLRVSGFVTHLLQQLAHQHALPEWKMPAEWRDNDYHPLQLEEYLRDKWRDKLASSVLQVPLNEVAWWKKKKLTKKNSASVDISRAKVSSMQLLAWEPKTFKLTPPCLEYYPQQLVGALLKHHKKCAPFIRAPDDLAYLKSECVQLTIPPILALKYHERNIRGLHSMKIAAWFASWCSVVPNRDVMSHLMSSPKEHCVNVNEKRHYVAILDTLKGWSCNEVLLPEDQITDALSFLSSCDVIRLFLYNYTIRQQWLALTLFEIFKIEIETIPLRVWPLPGKHIEAAKEVLASVKMMKELTLIGLYCHDNEMNSELRIFSSQYMLKIINCLKVFSQEGEVALLALKAECLKSLKKAQYVNPSYFELHADIHRFYSDHPWNFEYHNRAKRNGSTSKMDPIHLMELSYSNWRKLPMFPSCLQRPDFKGLLGNDAYALIRTNSWNKKGKFVKEIVEAMGCIGYIPWCDRYRVLTVELHSGKFDKPLGEMIEGDYASMGLIGKIGCHCLVLLNAANTFKATGQALSNPDPETLAGRLIHMSYDVFEMEHLHRLAALLGHVCKFIPNTPLEILEGSYSHLLEAIRGAKVVEQTIVDSDFLKIPECQNFNEEPLDYECGIAVCGFWLREHLSYRLLKSWLICMTNEGDPPDTQSSSILHYLFPCYINLLEEHSNDELTYSISFLLLRLLTSCQQFTLRSKHTNEPTISSLKVDMISSQNKILQILNSAMDVMSGNLSEHVANIFISTNWCFENSVKTPCKTLVSKAMINYQKTLYPHYTAFLILLLKLAGIDKINNKEHVFSSVDPDQSETLKSLYMLHQVTGAMYNALKHEETVVLSHDFKKAMVVVQAKEVQTHISRSYLYLLVSSFYQSTQRELYFDSVGKVFLEYWLGLWEARGCIKKKLSASFKGLPKNVFGMCVQAFMDGDYSVCNLLLTKPLLEGTIGEEVYSKIMRKCCKLAGKDLVWPQYDDEMSPLNASCSSGYGDSNSWKSSSSEMGSDDGKKEPVKAKKNYKPPREVIKAIKEAQKQKQERTCAKCKEKESGKKNFLTCIECLKTGFPNVNYYCSVTCQTSAWSTSHEEEHLLHQIEKNLEGM